MSQSPISGKEKETGELRDALSTVSTFKASVARTVSMRAASTTIGQSFKEDEDWSENSTGVLYLLLVTLCMYFIFARVIRNITLAKGMEQDPFARFMVHFLEYQHEYRRSIAGGVVSGTITSSRARMLI